MNWGINEKLEDNTIRERVERGESGIRLEFNQSEAEVGGGWIFGGNLRSTTRGTERVGESEAQGEGILVVV